MTWTTVRNHLIGVLVIFHLLYVGIAPMRVARPQWYEEGSTTRQVVQAWEDVRKQVNQWGKPYNTYCGVRQAWGMFGNPSRLNGRVEIAYHDGEKWQNLWVGRSPRHTWNRHQFEQYRWREMLRQFHKSKARSSWRNFGPWVSKRVFAQYPEAQRVRIRVRNARIPDPPELRRTRQLKFTKKGWQQIIERGES